MQSIGFVEFCLAYWLHKGEYETLIPFEQSVIKKEYKNWKDENHTIESIKYRDKEWNKITLEERAVLFKDNDYKIIKQTNIKWLLVSTIWLGLNHWPVSWSWLYYETMIFNDHDWLFTQRYHSLSKAKKGHEKIINLLEATLIPVTYNNINNILSWK